MSGFFALFKFIFKNFNNRSFRYVRDTVNLYFILIANLLVALSFREQNSIAKPKTLI
ncbi:hypothetical protein SAMN05444380_10539 [Thermophagus xiamenensis]|uniref:Uncharacterized protein n=1 Tax=Thermophagus xiamenensis TaxID=385682 RepID=A0A1I1WUS6_9BACT|nr:hypothetical protein SAMN05444380_10539 [Thermophagus xiamenensis]